MKPVAIIMRRELASYFATPIAYVVLVIFLFLANLFAFCFGGLYERRQADLAPFFNFLPWLYLILIPAVSMRLWAEERRSGSIELLLTQPVTLWQAVLGKFLAAWVFVGIALALTFPVWVTINYLGNPDNGAIIAAYLGSLVRGRRLPRGRVFTSTLTKNQLVAFLHRRAAPASCCILVGYPVVTDWFSGWSPAWLVNAIASLSFYTHFENIAKGVLDLRDVLYYALVTVFFLLASTVVLERLQVEITPAARPVSTDTTDAQEIHIRRHRPRRHRACCSSASCCSRTSSCAAPRSISRPTTSTPSPTAPKHIVKGLKEPVNLYFFFSEKTAAPIPLIRNHGIRVRELLEELVSRSDGKLTLKVIDPQPFSEEEDRANELGHQLGPP